jgi:RHS repeat-associated protein
LAPVSLGEGILFNACDASEADISNPQTIVDTCACEQSTYWSEATGVNCSSLPIIYYYHPDYLGSVEFITDMRGDPYQFFFNTIWGENLQNQLAFNTTAFSSRFRFNGKEWDEETGNFYYGARYYDPKISVWLSVDPKAASFPAFTPYDMLLNNPLMMVDPGGDSTYTINSKGYVTAVDGIRYFREWGNEYVAVKPGEKYEGCGVEVSKVQSEDDPEKFIYVSKRAMEQRKKTNRVLSSDLNDKTDIYQFESEAEGRKYFEFAAKITGVEWSILAIGNGNNAAGGKDFYVGTSHTEDAEGLTGYFDLLGLQILWGDHSHPADGPLHKGDSETIPRLDKKNQAARFRVYFPFQDSYQEYNQNTLR